MEACCYKDPFRRAIPIQAYAILERPEKIVVYGNLGQSVEIVTQDLRLTI